MEEAQGFWRAERPFPLRVAPLSGFKPGRARPPSLIVLHYSAGFTAQSCFDALQARKLSAHYTIERDGEFWQHVVDGDVAQHAGDGSWWAGKNINSTSLGIEIVNIGYMDGIHKIGKAFYPAGGEVNPRSDGNEYYRDETYKTALGRVMTTRVLTKTACAQFPDHRHAWQSKLWSKYTEEQLQAVVWQVAAWCREFEILPDAVLGHDHISPARKQDPGPAFPWLDFSESLEFALGDSLLLDPGHRIGERVKHCQAHLARLGLPVGKVDGSWGRKTSAAVDLAWERFGDIYSFSALPSLDKRSAYEVTCVLRRAPGGPT